MAFGLAAVILVCSLTIFWNSPAPAQAIRFPRIVPFEVQWLQYKSRFMLPSGRIVDDNQRNISHSESQGTGMIFAIFANDEEAFDHIWAWTRDNLRRQDGLFAWKYDPVDPDNPVPDPNNATDGDLYMAWALLMAGNLWGDRSYIAEAEKTIAGLEESVIEHFANRRILRPGAVGYTGYQERILNLSYCVFPALQEIAAHTQSDLWVDVYRDCLMFVQNAGFGKMALPLDWMTFTTSGTVAPAPRRPARFGYDAIRVPLYLVWAGHHSASYIDRYSSAWRRFSQSDVPPSWINPLTGESAEYRAAKGFLAVRRLVDYARARHSSSPKAARTAALRFPGISRQDDYFSSSLVMFSTLAAMTLETY